MNPFGSPSSSRSSSTRTLITPTTLDSIPVSVIARILPSTTSQPDQFHQQPLHVDPPDRLLVGSQTYLFSHIFDEGCGHDVIFDEVLRPGLLECIQGIDFCLIVCGVGTGSQGSQGSQGHGHGRSSAAGVGDDDEGESGRGRSSLSLDGCFEYFLYRLGESLFRLVAEMLSGGTREIVVNCSGEMYRKERRFDIVGDASDARDGGSGVPVRDSEGFKSLVKSMLRRWSRVSEGLVMSGTDGAETRRRGQQHDVAVFGISIEQLIQDAAAATQDGSGAQTQTPSLRRMKSLFRVVLWKGMKDVLAGGGSNPIDDVPSTPVSELELVSVRRFGSFVQDMISAPLLQYVPRNGSVVMDRLGDILGGNCLTTVIVNVARETKIREGVLGLLASLRHIRNFPVVNDDMSLGLRFRRLAEISWLRRFGGSGTSVAKAGTSAKVSEMEQRLIRMSMDLIRVSREKTSQERELMEARNALAMLKLEERKIRDGLRRSEEERLKLAQILSRIEDITGLLPRTDLGDVDSDDESSQENERIAEQLLHRMSLEQEEKKQIVLEYVALKKNFSRIATRLKDLQLKNDHLNLELLRMIRESDRAKRKRDIVEKQEYLQAMAALKKENVLITKEFNKSQLQISALQTNVEKLAIQLKTREVEIDRIHLEAKTSRRDDEFLSLKMQLKKAQFQVSQLRALAEQLKFAESKKSEEAEGLRARLEDLEEVHRAKLREFIERFNSLKGSGSGTRIAASSLLGEDGAVIEYSAEGAEYPSRSRTGAPSSLEEVEAAELHQISENVENSLSEMNEDLMATYREKEIRLVEEHRKAQEMTARVIAQRSLLLEKYIDLKLTFLSKVEDEHVFDSLLISDQDLEQIQSENAEYQQEQEEELVDLRRRLAVSEKTIIKLKEQNVRTGEGHQTTVVNLQQKYMRLLKDYANLKASVHEAGGQQEELSTHIDFLKDRVLTEMNAIRSSQSSEVTVQIEEMTTRIAELEEECRNKGVDYEKMIRLKEDAEAKLKVAILNEKKARVHVRHLEKHYRVLKKSHRDIEAEMKSSLRSNSALEELKVENAQLKRENELLQSAVRGTEHSELISQYNATRLQLQAECASYKSKCRMLEEQLEMMQAYMRKRRAPGDDAAMGSARSRRRGTPQGRKSSSRSQLLGSGMGQAVLAQPSGRLPEI